MTYAEAQEHVQAEVRQKEVVGLGVKTRIACSEHGEGLKEQGKRGAHDETNFEWNAPLPHCVKTSLMRRQAEGANKWTTKDAQDVQ